MLASLTIASVSQTTQTCQPITACRLAVATAAKQIPITIDPATTPTTAMTVSINTVPWINSITIECLSGVTTCMIDAVSNLSLKNHTLV